MFTHMEDKKKYICKLPTNGHQPGDEVFLTEAEVANENAGEAEPRFVLAEDQGTVNVADVHTQQAADTQAATADPAPEQQ